MEYELGNRLDLIAQLLAESNKAREEQVKLLRQLVTSVGQPAPQQQEQVASFDDLEAPEPPQPAAPEPPAPPKPKPRGRWVK